MIKILAFTITPHSGFVYSTPNYPDIPNSNKCFLKHKMDLQTKKELQYVISGTLMHYDCRENHNCGGSYVRFRDSNAGQFIGQEKTYCGKTKPDDFYSLGSHAQVKISFDSTTQSTAEFRAKYKGRIFPLF